MKLSVVIPAYNAEQTLATTLGSITNPAGHEVEVVVVDDCSDDGTAEIARRGADHTLVLEERSGPSRARNAGARVASGDVLVFTDADVELLPDTLSRIADTLQRHEEYGVVAGTLTPESPCETFIGTYKNLYMHYAFKDTDELAGSPYTSILGVRGSVFRETNGFEDVLPNEDRLFGIALARAGHTIFFDRELQVRHHRCYGPLEFLRIETERSRNIVRLHLETRLLKRGSMREHIPTCFVVGAALVLATVLAAVLGMLWSPWTLILLGAAPFAFAWTMRRFIGFLRDEKGTAFALAGAAFAAFDLALCVVGALTGIVAFAAGGRLIEP